MIEILAHSVRENQSIEGVQVLKKQVKSVFFADDSTFFLKNMGSLKILLAEMRLFSQFSSLHLNSSKSEVAYLGPCNRLEAGCDVNDFKWVDLHSKGIKILGIYFSYNKTFLQKNNFERVFNNMDTVLNMWTTRNLTVYGKISVLKSLAMANILYICNMLWIPDEFIKRVKQRIADFIWNGRKPKIKFSTLINDYDKGGLKLPDLESMIKTFRVEWMIRLITEQPIWAPFLEAKLNSVGGIHYLRTNFDVSAIPPSLNQFYSSVFRSWAEDKILSQPFWNNKYITEFKVSPSFSYSYQKRD